MKIAIVIPVKERSGAKTRLAPLLSPPERSLLAAAMLADVSRALAGITHTVVVITSCPAGAAFAVSRGWRIFRETVQVSESRSVDRAARELKTEGFAAVLRIPADIPLLRSEDIAAIIDQPFSGRFACLTPSWDGTGTNALLRSPPDLFPSRFGAGSLSLHLAAAAAADSEIRITTNENISLDLDEPQDIARFLERPSDTETYRLLNGFDILSRSSPDAG